MLEEKCTQHNKKMKEETEEKQGHRGGRRGRTEHSRAISFVNGTPLTCTSPILPTTRAGGGEGRQRNGGGQGGGGGGVGRTGREGRADIETKEHLCLSQPPPPPAPFFPS